jgi:hypothetical protein
LISLARIGALSILGFVPERQFLYYSWPCLNNRESRGKVVLEKHLRELALVMSNGSRPRRSLLRFIFPDAYRGITTAAQVLRVQRWSQAAVEHYFLMEHNRYVMRAQSKGVPSIVLELCKVKTGVITDIVESKYQLRLSSGEIIWALNILDIPHLHAGLLVAIHGRMIVDVLHPDSLEKSHPTNTG